MVKTAVRRAGRLGVTGLLAAGLMMGASAASAEGSRQTSIPYVSPGWEGSRWTDQNRDAQNTTLDLSQCRTSSGTLAQSYADVGIWRDIQAFPDSRQGGARFGPSNCFQGTGYYGFSVGRTAAGGFYVKVEATNQSSTFRAQGASIKW